MMVFSALEQSTNIIQESRMLCPAADLDDVWIVVCLKINKPWRIHNITTPGVSSTSSLPKLIATPGISDPDACAAAAFFTTLSAKDDAVAVSARHVERLLIHKHLHEDWGRSFLYQGVIDAQLADPVGPHRVY